MNKCILRFVAFADTSECEKFNLCECGIVKGWLEGYKNVERGYGNRRDLNLVQCALEYTPYQNHLFFSLSSILLGIS